MYEHEVAKEIGARDREIEQLRNALDALKVQYEALVVQLDATRKNLHQAEQTVKELLWDDPEDEPTLGPAWGDLLHYLTHQKPYPTELYAMMKQGAKKWMQLKDKLTACQRERDELQKERGELSAQRRAWLDSDITAMTLVQQEKELLEATSQLDELRNELEAVSKERDGLEDQIREMYQRNTALKEQYDKLAEICQNIVDRGIGTSDVKAMKAVLAKVGKTGEET